MRKIGVHLTKLIAVVAIFIAGCGRQDVATNKLAQVDLSNYDTYAWLPSGDTSMNSLSKDPTLAAGVREKVNSELNQRGYKLNPKYPDFLVLVHTMYNEKVDVNTLPNSYSYYGPGFNTGPWYDGYYSGYNSIGYINGPSVNAVEYTKGTVVIDIVDADTKEVVWRGRAADPIYDQTEIVEEAREIVGEIFEEYPVQASAR